MADTCDEPLPPLPPGYAWRKQPRESVIDPVELAKRLEFVPERYSFKKPLECAAVSRDELISLGGRPTRELRTILPDPINPDYESDELIADAITEHSFWLHELRVWKFFLRWREVGFERRNRDRKPGSSPEPPFLEPHKVDAYALHLELRTYLIEGVKFLKEFAPSDWWQCRARLESLEPQLAEMRVERGLPADDNPPPPFLVALRAAEEAEKAAELAAVLVRPGPRVRKPEQPRLRQAEQKERRAVDHAGGGGKRKRDRDEEETTERSADEPAEQPAAQLPQLPPAKRRAARQVQAPTVVQTDEPRRSARVTTLPQK
ncbi:hypothetical protein SPI_09420 [Niveomyces insectorum RCEF 264]|uniref:Uncharacterized protein n=1 Tax=Niveomyces insectorum RCEF 264 TaxID=1081102 RepID=A0A167LTV6_9HYPO|nr:hypothetical protein SPI_09420 [Niveomyces insectorum RCEF 264]